MSDRKVKPASSKPAVQAAAAQAAAASAAKQQSIKLGKATSPVNASDHGKLCECVECVTSNFEQSREISTPCIRCFKKVSIHVEINCEAVRTVKDYWSYHLDGEKCEEIDPEPLPCDPPIHDNDQQ